MLFCGSVASAGTCFEPSHMGWAGSGGPGPSRYPLMPTAEQDGGPPGRGHPRAPQPRRGHCGRCARAATRPWDTGLRLRRPCHATGRAACRSGECWARGWVGVGTRSALTSPLPICRLEAATQKMASRAVAALCTTMWPSLASPAPSPTCLGHPTPTVVSPSVVPGKGDWHLSITCALVPSVGLSHWVSLPL